MRVRVIGDSESAVAVRSSLFLSGGVVISEVGYGYTVEIEDQAGWPTPTIDGVDCDFERRLLNSIATVANTPVLMLRPGGVQSDRHVKIGVPTGAERHLIEQAIMRAVVQMLVPVDQPVTKADNAEPHGFWARLKYLFTGRL